MIYNDKFVKNYSLKIVAPLFKENKTAQEYTTWAFANKIRMKVRLDSTVIGIRINVYFEDAEDVLAFKLKFGL